MSGVTANGNRTLSTLDLSLSLSRSVEWTEGLLAESERCGVVERVKDRWRLSPEGERRIGPALRALSLPRDGV
jgi:hypothetical protein